MVDKSIGVLLAIVGVASLAVVVSKKANTVAVLTSFLTGFANAIKAAVSPITAK